MIQSCLQHWRGLSAVFRRAQHQDYIRLLLLIQIRLLLNLPSDPEQVR